MMKKTLNFYIMSSILPAIIFFIWTWAAFNMMDSFLNFIFMLIVGVGLIAFAIAMGIFAYTVAERIVLVNILMLLSRVIAFMAVYLRFEKNCSLGEAVLKILTFFISPYCIVFVFSLSAISVASSIISFVIMNTSILCPSCQNKFYSKDAQQKMTTIGESEKIKVLICPHCNAPVEKSVANPFIVSFIIPIIFMPLILQNILFVIPLFILVIALMLWYAKLKHKESKKNFMEH